MLPLRSSAYQSRCLFGMKHRGRRRERTGSVVGNGDHVRPVGRGGEGRETTIGCACKGGGCDASQGVCPLEEASRLDKTGIQSSFPFSYFGAGSRVCCREATDPKGRLRPERSKVLPLGNVWEHVEDPADASARRARSSQELLNMPATAVTQRSRRTKTDRIRFNVGYIKITSREPTFCKWSEKTCSSR